MTAGHDASDEVLLARVASGDRHAALAELYDRYAARLYGLGVRTLGDRGQAEELVQETFVRVWQGAARFDEAQGTVGTWVRVIGRRVAVDLQRRAAARPKALAHGAETAPEPRDPAITEELAERALVSVEVREALESLAPKQREVLLLGYDAQLSQSEIAERLAIPLGTVKTRTFHGLKALRALLEQRGLL